MARGRDHDGVEDCQRAVGEEREVVCKRGDGRRGSEHAELDRDGRGVVKDRLELVSAHYASHII